MLLLIACVPSPALDVWEPPPFADLIEQEAPPDPFVLMSTGATITSPTTWSLERAPELRQLFSHYVYGYAPGVVPVVVTEVSRREGALEGRATILELDVAIEALVVQVVVFLPPGEGPFPLILGLEKCGNHTVTDDAAVRAPAAWPDPYCEGDETEAGRGVHAESWAIPDTLARGYAVATFAQSDIDPDDADPLARAGRARELFEPEVEADHAWGTVAAWSWGLRRVLDGLLTLPELDTGRVMLWGHSRRGKAALWAAANDPRVAMVWAHQSGIVGAALERGSTGETVGLITGLFPHWFAPQFASFTSNEPLLPVDQHLLLALVAPRPLLVTDGDDDSWANPPGAEAAVSLAQPVFDLLGSDSAHWEMREGQHEVLATDWPIALDFAAAEGL